MRKSELYLSLHSIAVVFPFGEAPLLLFVIVLMRVIALIDPELMAEPSRAQ